MSRWDGDAAQESARAVVDSCDSEMEPQDRAVADAQNEER
jgi:hypothetical protein